MRQPATQAPAARRRALRQMLRPCAAAALCLCVQGTATLAWAQGPLTLWFDHPAQDWEREILPIGNGAMGAAVQGGLALDTLQFNEKTLWTGGPGSTSGYDFGIPGKSQAPALDALEKVRRALAEKGSLAPEAVAEQLGRKAIGYGHYQSFGELQLHFPQNSQAGRRIVDYRRELDITRGLARVSYRADGVRFTREYLASYPDGVIAVHLSADREQQITFTARLKIPENRSADFSTVLSSNNPPSNNPAPDNPASTHRGHTTVSGQLHDNGLTYETQLHVIAEGGEINAVGDSAIRVSGADSATLLIAAGTGYAAEYPHYRGPNPHNRVQARMDRASHKGYPTLRAAHIADYRSLFDRVTLNLNGTAPAGHAELQLRNKPQTRPTIPPIDQRLKNYGTGNPTADRALEALYFQYGRYLLIASSRPGSLPANLQGVWNNSATPPWNADYHANINLQMNYWPAEVTNLAETTAPLFDFVDSLQKPGALAAEKILGARGWTLFLNTNIWGFTGVIDWPTAFWQPEAGAWLADHYYQHYLFGKDEEFLRERAYPVMKGAAQLWLDALVVDPRDGLLVVSPSYSPEHGDFTAGAAMSQQIVFQLLYNTRDAARRLGDSEFARQLDQTLANLDRGLRIGSWGQLQEWKADLDDPHDTHRHVSHLYALYPAHQIDSPKLLEAARTSLAARGDAGTGWSRAWKIALWARLHDGDHAHKILAAQLRESTLPNLWSSHPPFQIDGNFGATAGMAEMLLQSHNGVIRPLPALPTSWADGSVTGLRARGGATLDMTWREGQLHSAHIHATRNGELKLRLPRNSEFTLRHIGDNKILHPREKDKIKIFDARAGESYLLTRAEPVVAGR